MSIMSNDSRCDKFIKLRYIRVCDVVEVLVSCILWIYITARYKHMLERCEKFQ